MPALGAEADEGTVIRWLVHEGDAVRRGEVVAEVETDKATVEVEIFTAGIVERLVVQEGEKVPVGTVLAMLRAAEAPVEAEQRRTPAVPARAAAPPPAAAITRPAAAPQDRAPVTMPALATTMHAPRATPTAARLAATLGVDLAGVTGSGVGGAITRSDVERAAKRRAEAPARPRISPRARRLARERGVDLGAVVASGPGSAITGADIERLGPAPPVPRVLTPARPAADRIAARRRAIAAAMERSNREIPHYYLGSIVDMSSTLAWLAETNAERPVAARVLPAALFVKAVALAARQLPEFNGFWIEGGFRQAEAVHVGVAISLREGGLVAPAIHDTDTLTLEALMAATRDLVNRSRGGGLRASEMADPTITVTNLGDQGVETVFPVIFAPQVAIVGIGRVVERPWAEDGMLAVRPVVHVSLAADHRASDGHRGGLFLRTIERLLKDPAQL